MKDNKMKFNEMVNKHLPENILVGNTKYRLKSHGLMSGGYRISYGEFNGDYFNWDNKLIDLFYEIGEKPFKKRLSEESTGILFFSDNTIFVKNIDEIISDCLLKLYEHLDEIITRESEFDRELTSLLNKYSKENESNTPDFLLSSYMNVCLRNYNSIFIQREKWLGKGEKKEKNIIDEI